MSGQYIVSARKYRPANFHSVVGQKNLTQTLKGSIESGRLAHAYLFCGPRGVGKTSCARIFAKTINCLSPTPEGEACGHCESCLAIDRGNSFNLVELDAASNNSVDDIRVITEQVNVPPQVGKYRVFIIDEVHMLSSAAFNAFLKTLEEPPSYVVFILATTEKHKVIPTILSRCQIYDFKRITIQDMVEHLQYVASQENIQADPRALGVIARKADGAMRDALSIFDQVSASCQGNITYDAVVENLNVLDYDVFFKLIDAFAAGDAPEALLIYKDVRDRGFDSLFFINSLAQHVRDLMVAADKRTLPLLETADDVAERLSKQASSLPLKWYYAAMQLLNDCDLNYRTASNKQLLVELTLIRLCQLIAPQTPPFDIPVGKVALRDPMETTGATHDSHISHAEKAPSQATSEPEAPLSPTPVQTSPTPEPDSKISAPAPLTPTTETPPKAARKPLRRPAGGSPLHTFRLSEDVSVNQKSIDKENNTFSDDDFLKAWHAFADANAEHHILASAMRQYTPRRTGDTEFTALVGHPAEQQAFDSAMPKLLEFIRTKVANDFLTVRVAIDPEKAVSKFLPQNEFFKKIVDNNPDIAGFLKDLDVEFA